jgi:hypothetical protein
MAIRFYTDEEFFEKLQKNSIPSDEYGFMIPIQTLNELAVDPFVPPEKSDIIMEMLKAAHGQPSKVNLQYI